MMLEAVKLTGHIGWRPAGKQPAALPATADTLTRRESLQLAP
jgi:hypothetical protein